MTRLILTALLWLGAIPAATYLGMTLAYRAEMIDLSTLFGALINFQTRSPGWLILALLAAGVVEFILLIVLLIKGRAGAAVTAFAIGLVSVAMALGPIQMFQTATTVPAIHDITTDIENPPAFEATAAFRTGERMNPAAYDEQQMAAQLEAYPDLATIEVAAYPDKAYEAALKSAEAIGLEIMQAEKSRGRVEGTATTRWFGFKDDVVIRIVPAEDGGSLIDIRSKSRIGASDIGANAARIRELRRMILEALGEEAVEDSA